MPTLRLVLPLTTTIESLVHTVHPDADADGVISKAGVGFSRGPKAGHKYWRRVRVMQGGKLAWKYYYNTPEDRAAYADLRDKKRKVDNAKRRLRSKLAQKKDETAADYERRKVAHQKLLEGEDLTAGDLHGLRADFKAEHAAVLAAHRAVEDLTDEYLTELLSWESPVNVTVTQAARTFSDNLDDGEPEGDPRHKMIDARRATEQALKIIPAHILKSFDGCVPEIVIGTSEDSYAKGGAAGFCRWGTGAQIKKGADLVWTQADVMATGNTNAAHTLLHEMAHAIHMRMMVTPDENIDGLPSWNEWVKTCNDWIRVKGSAKDPERNPPPGSSNAKNPDGEKKEPPVSEYGGTNYLECFTESMSYALMQPKLMAAKSPKAYEFFRKFLGEAYCRPHETDEARKAELVAELAKTTDGAERERLRHLIDMQDGLDGMDADDERLAWWDQTSKSPVATAIKDHVDKHGADVAYQDNWEGFINPPDEDKLGQQGKAPHDRFYEMSYGGRTVYLRVGPGDTANNWSGWDPATAETSSSNVVLQPDEVKEVYDENGDPIDRDLIYWHLHQEVYKDPNAILGVVKVDGHPVEVSLADIVDGGTLKRSLVEGDNQKAKAVAAFLETQTEIRYFMRSLTTDTHNSFYEPGDPEVKAGTAQVGEVKFPKKLQTYEEYVKQYKKQKLAVGEPSEAKYELERAQFIAKATMQPHEITHHTFRQRSGTFNYDHVGMAGQEHLDRLRSGGMTDAQRREVLESLRKAQPGIETVNRDPDTGKFTKPRVVVDAETGLPRFRRKKFVNANPDGTSTVLYTARGDDGFHRLEDPMWRALLTPNDEPIRSAEQLQDLLRRAAAERRTTWVSIRTDRRRVKKGSRWVMEPAGDTAEYLHVQVEFDGHGQPKILGKTMRDKLGVDTPRLDHLLRDDPVFGRVRDNARPIIEGNQIRLKPTTGGEALTDPPRGGDYVVLQGLAGDEVQALTRGEERLARVTKIIPEKKAGEVPPPPRWDMMPDGVPELEREDPPGKRQKLRKKEAEYKAMLPEWYESTPAQREWFDKHFMPAVLEWERTKESETAKFYPETYILNVGGRKITRTRANILTTTRRPYSATAPEPLASDVLVYRHEDINPTNGQSTGRSSLRIVAPQSGPWGDARKLATLPGVDVAWKEKPRPSENFPGIIDHLTVPNDEFHLFRDAVGGGLSLTDAANRVLRERVENLKGAKAAAETDEHILDTSQITPAWLIDNWGCALNKTLPTGATFTLAEHQQEVLQKMLDNDGRVLAAHYMGTGKTVSTIVACKMMMMRPDPADPSKLNPNNPKRPLVVAPLNTVEQWRQAASDFDESALVIGAGANDLPIESFFEDGDIRNGKIIKTIPEGQIVVCGPEYFTLYADAMKRLGIDGLAIDEAHMGIKEESTERNKKVQEWNPDMKMLMLLTGTPMTVSPADSVEYVRLLSKGKVWSDMDRKKFTETYLEQTTIGAELGTGKKQGAKVQVKASKRGQLAAILGQWMHIALPKDVKGKTLPAVRIEENRHAFMQGVQAQLFNLYLATAGEDIDARALSAKEQERLTEEARRATSAAKAVANCPAFRPGSTEQYITYQTVEVNEKGKPVRKMVTFQTKSVEWLFSEAIRGKAAGKWPRVDELDPAEVAIYDALLGHVLGKSYAECAGKKITADQKAAMIADGWNIPGGRKVDNPDFGPLGVQFRGGAKPWNEVMDERIAAASGAEKARLMSEKADRQREIDRALSFQRKVRHALKTASANSRNELDAMTIIAGVAADEGLSFEEASDMMAVHPVPTERVATIEYVAADGTRKTLDADERITVTMGKGAKAQEVSVPRQSWVSDKSGSRHLLYDPEDWDYAANKPKEGAISLMDPGKRESRERADIAMTHQNAKAEELMDHIRRFHADGGDAGPEGARQMVLFGNGILDSCRTMEATLRVQGFRDVNEVLEGSPHYDPNDPTAKDGSPNGKYFVTYIGGTYTGDRELNVSIFQKVKDKLGRDSEKSLFVFKCEEPANATKVRLLDDAGQPTGDRVNVNWMVYRGDHEHYPVRMSQWTADQRASIKTQFGIVAPESFIEVSNADGSISTVPFFGSADKVKNPFFQPGKRLVVGKEDLNPPMLDSASLLRLIVLQGDPTKETDPAKAEEIRHRIATLKGMYVEMAKKGVAKPDAPKAALTDKQRTIFNNCEMIICSDAAQVGMNLGNAVEMVMYDSLASPMAEWQRITRSARMLPPAVDEALRGKPKTERKENPDFDPSQPESDDNPKSMDVPVRDENGQFVWTGAFSQIKALEPDLFNAGARNAPGGVVTGLRLSSAFPDSDGKPMDPRSFTEALDMIRAKSLAKVEDIRANGTRADRLNILTWESIAAKCAVASNLGGQAARALFDELAATQTPGGSDPLIRFPATGIKWTQPEAGTYDSTEAGGNDIVSAEVQTAIRRAIDALPEVDKAAIMDAGFVKEGCPDATAVYLALRAQEVMEWMEGNREDVAREMRGKDSGRVVTDADVQNRLIDMLTPEDRAVLKSKKYLVNVRKIGVAGHIGQIVNHTYKEGKDVTEERVHTGYEMEHPVRTESATRATGRARMIAFEQILSDVQKGVAFEIDGDFADVHATQFADISRIEKSVSLVLDWDALEQASYETTRIGG